LTTLAGLRRVEGLRALRHRNFRLWWVGQLVSLIGTWMQQVAMAWLVLTLTNDPLLLGLLAAGQYGPVLVFGLVGGVFVDALPKRRVLLATQAIAMTVALVLGVLALTGIAEVWHVILLAAVLGLLTVIDLPTRHAFFIEMVGRDDLPNAVALNSAIFNTARVAGPAIAGLTIATLGVPLAFILNGISFVAVLGCLIAMRSSELMPGPRSDMPKTVSAVIANLSEGLRYLRQTRHLMVVVAVLGLTSTAALNFTVVIPPLARDVLAAGPSGYGFLMSAAGIGSLTAALSTAFRVRPRTLTIIGGALLLGSFEAVLSGSRWLPLSMACMYAMGLGSTSMAMGTQTVIQLSVPDHLRGRLSAVFTTILVGTTPIGGLIAGALASSLGTPQAILIGGLAGATVALIALALAWRWRLLGSATLPAAPRPRDPDGEAPRREPEGREAAPVSAYREGGGRSGPGQ
jgi:MFS family permease